MPRIFISQKYHNLEPGTYHSEINPIDKGNSHICAAKGNNKASNYLMILGYLLDGRIFQLLFSGQLPSDIDSYINQSVLPKIKSLPMTFDDDPYDVMTELLDAIIKDYVRSHHSILNVKIAFAITYYDFGFYCAGFSFGEHGIVIRDACKVVVNVLEEPLVHLEKSAFVFDESIEPGDEIVMYTFDNHRQLHRPDMRQNDSLLYGLIAKLKMRQAKQNDATSNDDWIFGRMIVPHIDQCHRLWVYHAMVYVKDVITVYLEEFDHPLARLVLFYPSKNIARLKHYLALFEEHHDDLFTCKLIIESLLTHPKESAWFHYCDKLTRNSLSCVKKNLSRLWSEPLNNAKLTEEEIHTLKELIANALDEYKHFDFIETLKL